MNRKSLRFKLEYILVKCISCILRILPFRCYPYFAKILSRIWYILDIKHRKRAEENIKNILSCKKPKKLSKKVFQHLSLNILEFIRTSWLSKDEMTEWIKIENEEILKQAYEEGKGVVVVTAHIGNWELAGMILAIKGYPIYSIARPLDNNLLENFVKGIREKWGQKIVPKKKAYKEGMKIIKEKKMLAILMDQDAGKGGIVCEFLGKNASTTPLPALFLYKGIPVIFGYDVRIDGKHILKIEKRLEPVLVEEKETFIKKVTLELNRYISKAIEKYPEQWLWIHRRWKSGNNVKEE